MFVTTSYRPSEKETSEAQQLAAKLRIPYIERGQETLSGLYRREQLTAAFVIAKGSWRYQEQSGYQFVFHPNMSLLRMKQIQNGQTDTMASCASLTEGDEVLDCTMGMGADAIVASAVVGSVGKVVALENRLVIATIVKQGLKTYQAKDTQLMDAMRRIQVLQADYRVYLPNCPDASFDVVLFDPMFRETIKESAAMQQLKPLADPTALDLKSVQEATRVARRVVLLKERRGSSEFARLGFTVIHEASGFAWGMRRSGQSE